MRRTEEGLRTKKSQTESRPGSLHSWTPAWHRPPGPPCLPRPPLTNHQGCGLEIGVKRTTALAIFQEDVPPIVLCKREVLHVLQGSRAGRSGPHRGVSELGGRAGRCSEGGQQSEGLPLILAPGAQSPQRLAMTPHCGWPTGRWRGSERQREPGKGGDAVQTQEHLTRNLAAPTHTLKTPPSAKLCKGQKHKRVGVMRRVDEVGWRGLSESWRKWEGVIVGSARVFVPRESYGSVLSPHSAGRPAHQGWGRAPGLSGPLAPQKPPSRALPFTRGQCYRPVAWGQPGAGPGCRGALTM